MQQLRLCAGSRRTASGITSTSLCLTQHRPRLQLQSEVYCSPSARFLTDLRDVAKVADFIVRDVAACGEAAFRPADSATSVGATGFASAHATEGNSSISFDWLTGVKSRRRCSLFLRKKGTASSLETPSRHCVVALHLCVLVLLTFLKMSHCNFRSLLVLLDFSFVPSFLWLRRSCSPPSSASLIAYSGCGLSTEPSRSFDEVWQRYGEASGLGGSTYSQENGRRGHGQKTPSPKSAGWHKHLSLQSCACSCSHLPIRV